MGDEASSGRASETGGGRGTRPPPQVPGPASQRAARPCPSPRDATASPPLPTPLPAPAPSPADALARPCPPPPLATPLPASLRPDSGLQAPPLRSSTRSPF